MKLNIYFQLWKIRKGAARYKAVHGGTVYGLNSLEEARAFAKRNGYRGIQIQSMSAMPAQFKESTNGVA